ncbi:MAG: hypothetical protein C4560_05535 [Nitrospiraceae bacterium]|nr:MAG: hypothetical protein C4560_05535 [Nitrospiraceae bacterium]
MNKTLILAFAGMTLLAGLLISCAVGHPGIMERPTLFTIPTNYIYNFPLEKTITKQELIDLMGVPDKSLDMDGMTYLTYEMGEGHGARQWIYIIKDNIIWDVRYHDQGPFNGISARTNIK